jgi:integrase
VQSEWPEVDFDAAVWRKPKEHMKKVNDVALPHIIPLSRQAVEILRALKLITGHQKYIFPGDPKRGHIKGEQKHISKATIYEALKRMGYQGEMTGHGFRGVATTILHEQGFQKEHIDEALAHQKRDKVDAAYTYAKYLTQRREIMQWWADYVDEALAEGRKRVAVAG